MIRISAPFVALAVLAAHSKAQSLNLDIGANVAAPTPSSTHAAAGSAGFWNAVSAPANATQLVALDGSSTSVTVTSNGGFLNFDYDNPATTGDAGNLLDDLQDLGGLAGTTTWTFSGLANGSYSVITYAWAPDNPSSVTHVVVAGSSDPGMDVGGTYPGAYQLGVTHALHHVTVASGSIAIVLTITNGFGSLNGIQLVKDTGAVNVCVGDGSGTACPCGNASPSGSGDGCLNSLGTGGRLRTSGAASIASDTFTLVGSAMPNSSTLYFQGTSAVGSGAGAVFGDGLRCAGGSVIRLGTKTNSGGGSQYPSAGDPSVSVKGADSAGNQRVYQAWYRNSASFCAPETFNLTNGVQVTWGI